MIYREEISHLIDILKSRVDNDGEKQKSSIDAGGDTELVSWRHETRRTPPEEKQQDIDGTMVGTFREMPDVPVGVSASPIDIARAYMAGRTSEGGYDLYNFMSKGERAQPINDFARKPLLPSPSPKPSICWPGAMVHDRHGYTTPQSQRVRHRLHDFPRTPYSRTILSKSSTKVKSSPFLSVPALLSYAVLTINDALQSPERIITFIFHYSVKISSMIITQTLAIKHSSKTATPKVLGGFLPSTDKNLEPGETSGASKHWSGDDVSGSSDRAISNPISSSQAVRKILEHLDRNKPTPKEKEAELKLATSWRRSSPSVPSDTIREENISSVH
ncbi:UNVERIFIED_CONTAM: hypothetical protein Sradi_5434900, partial [Sesamum radiatum]